MIIDIQTHKHFQTFLKPSLVWGQAPQLNSTFSARPFTREVDSTRPFTGERKVEFVFPSFVSTKIAPFASEVGRSINYLHPAFHLKFFQSFKK